MGKLLNSLNKQLKSEHKLNENIVKNDTEKQITYAWLIRSYGYDGNRNAT